MNAPLRRPEADPMPILTGRRVLIVEDEYFAAMELQRLVEEAGGEVVGPAGTLADARALVADDIDGAILDLRLDGNTSVPVAEALRRRGIPFLLVTGLEPEMLPPEVAGSPRLGKPYSELDFHRALRHLV